MTRIPSLLRGPRRKVEAIPPAIDRRVTHGLLTCTSVRVAHVITKMDRGGAQSMVCELARAQVDAGCEVTVLCGVLGPAADAVKDKGVRVLEVVSLRHAPSPIGDAQAVRSLVHEFRGWKPDLVHAHSSKGGLVGRIAAKRVGVPSVYTAHGWPFQAGAAATQRLMSLVGEWIGGRLGDEVVCVTKAEAELAARLRIGTVRHRHLIHNGVASAPAVERPIRTADQTFHVVMVARLDRPKRPDIVVRAIGLCDKRVKLQVVGDGALMAEVRSLVDSLELWGRVELLGDGDPGPPLAQANCFVLVSDYEGMPVTVLEAMRSGLPIVANPLPGIVEAVVGSNGDSQVALLVAGQPETVATAVMSLVDNPARAYELGLAGRNRWHAYFSADRMCAEYGELYRSVLATSSKST